MTNDRLYEIAFDIIKTGGATSQVVDAVAAAVRAEFAQEAKLLKGSFILD